MQIKVVLLSKKFIVNNETALTPFADNKIRKIWHEDQWYFSVVDVIEILTDSKNPSVYWSALKKREYESFTFCKRFNLPRANGKNYPADCANTEGV
jgi:DNA-damage-inducible protein D